MSVVWSAQSPTAKSSGVMDSLDRVKSAANQQMAWNRPDTSNPWAAQTNNPDGSISLGFTGPMAGAQKNLTAEALRNMGSPLDYSQFNSGTGDQFRQQAIAGAQGQMNDWLAPLQGHEDALQRQRLLDAGYQEGSPQFQKAMGQGAGSATDLQNSIHNAAIGLGGKQGAALQGMDLLSKQQGLAEALRRRSLPMEQLAAMQGLTKQPGVEGDNSIMQGAGMDYQQRLNQYLGKRAQIEAQNQADEQNGLNAGMSLFSSAASLGMNNMGSLNKKPEKPANGSPYGIGPTWEA